MHLVPVSPGSRARLAARDAQAPHGLPRDIDAATGRLLDELTRFQDALYAEGRRALLVVLQGRDAAGKDGTIRHVCRAFNPQGTVVASFGAPTGQELAHDYLWRVHAAMPPRGKIGVFNRSHYEDVLAARVHRLVPPAVWRPRYRQINEFERTLTECGVTIVKFFLHISHGEQRRRLAQRLADPHKNWKLSESDIADFPLWDAYTPAYRDVLARCSTRWAPWYIVPADDKAKRNYMVADVLRATLRKMGPKYPRASPALLKRAKRLL
jgi:PPK2 family polyphosphate:nucleotide phosphotransferase